MKITARFPDLCCDTSFGAKFPKFLGPVDPYHFLCFSRELHSKVPEKKFFVANFPFLMDSPKLLHHMTKSFHWCSLFKKACSIVLCVGGAMLINVDCSPCVFVATRPHPVVIFLFDFFYMKIAQLITA